MSGTFLFSTFQYLGDFFGMLSSLASDYTINSLITAITNSSTILLEWTNVVTGSINSYVLSVPFPFITSSVLEFFTLFTPNFALDMPLFLGMLCGSCTWYLFVSVFVFFKNVL